MLLRSSSTPILKSWIPSYYNNSNSSPNNINEPQTPPCLSRTNSISTRTLPSSPSSSPNLNPNTNTNGGTYNNHFRRGTTCTPYEHELDDPPYPKSRPLQRMFSSSRLDEEVSTEDSGGSDGGGGGGDGMYGGDGYGGGGGGSGFNDNSNSNSNSNNNEHGNIEAYYRKMIKSNPGDPLLLGNYAKFLKDVRGDLAKAEEYCGRAILANPSDANTLSMYADIIWEYRRDGELAESYFDQAIKAAPENCYIHATYAKFLWDVDEEEVGEEEKQDNHVGSPIPSSPSYTEELHYQSPTRV